jgi:hypothetical protein
MSGGLSVATTGQAFKGKQVRADAAVSGNIRWPGKNLNPLSPLFP